ncbi:YpbF family protein [Bacillus timonensis]|nr:YpbF family protein [Bacillus timonensis]
MGVVNIEQQFQTLNTNKEARMMLSLLIERKTDLNNYTKYEAAFKVGTFVILVLFLIYLTIFVVQPNLYSTHSIIQEILTNPFHSITILLILTGYGASVFFEKKTKSIIIEYENIRSEIVRKSLEYWPQSTHFEEKRSVFEWMKREYDINLYHDK